MTRLTCDICGDPVNDNTLLQHSSSDGLLCCAKHLKFKVGGNPKVIRFLLEIDEPEPENEKNSASTEKFLVEVKNQNTKIVENIKNLNTKSVESYKEIIKSIRLVNSQLTSHEKSIEVLKKK